MKEREDIIYKRLGRSESGMDGKSLAGSSQFEMVIVSDSEKLRSNRPTNSGNLFSDKQQTFFLSKRGGRITQAKITGLPVPREIKA